MKIDEYKNNDGIEMLLSILIEKDLTILSIRKREIEMLQIILKNEATITELIKIIVNYKLGENKNEQHTTKDNNEHN